jgi:hypothetical protein
MVETVHDVFPADAGPITLGGTLLGPIELTPSTDPSSPCYSREVPPESALVEAGTSLSFEVSGGTDFPAASATLTTPTLVSLSSGPLELGQPYALEWSGSGDGEVILFVSTYNLDTMTNAYVFCSVDDTGAFEIPASLTAELEPVVSGNVSVVRTLGTTIEPTDTSKLMRLEISLTAVRTIDVL